MFKTKIISIITISFALIAFSSVAKVTLADAERDNDKYNNSNLGNGATSGIDLEKYGIGKIADGGNGGLGEPIFISGADDREWTVPSDGILALNGGDDKNSIINRTGGQFTTLCSGGAGSGCTAAVKKGWRVMFYVNGNYNYASAVFTPMK